MIMSTITTEIGARIRMYRLRQGLTQEELAEKANLHNTYIGQVERGEKNLTLISLEKILSALHVTFAEFFEYMGNTKLNDVDYAAKCYALISGRTHAEQRHLFLILQEIESLSRQK